MTQYTFVLGVVLVVMTGCTSSLPPVPLYSAPQHQRPARHIRAVADVAPPVTAPEPKFTSKEWWTREYEHMKRATNICKGC